MGNLRSAVDERLGVEFRDLPLPALGEEIAEIDRQVTRLHAAYLQRVEVFD